MTLYAACWCRSLSKNCIRLEKLCTPRLWYGCCWSLVCTARADSLDCLNSRGRLHEFLYAFSFHSCNYGIFINWCYYIPWSISIYICSKYNPSCLIETLLQSTNHINVCMTPTKMPVRSAVLQYQLDSYTLCAITACHIICRVCIPLVDQILTPPLKCVLNTPDSALYTCSPRNVLTHLTVPFITRSKIP
jgi:hypothetical protein